MFGSLMRDMERDPIFGAHSRAMSRMMNSMNPFFGDFTGGGGGGGFPGMGMGMDLMPFGMGMGPMGGMGMGMNMGMGMGLHNFPAFRNMDQMTNNVPNQFDGAAFSSTSVMSMSMNGSGGEPIVYQASSSTRQGPGGVKETRKTVCDSRSGVKKMQVGRHLGSRGHVVEREENLFTGQREENEELLNLDFEEKRDFEREWRNRIHSGGNVERHAAITAGPSDNHSSHHHPHHHHQQHPHHHHHGSSSSTTYGPGVTIEEIDDNEEETPTTHNRAVPPIPRVSSPSHRRAPKDRRHKTSTSTSKRTKKY